jgi:hypothetical protein
MWVCGVPALVLALYVGTAERASAEALMEHVVTVRATDYAPTLRCPSEPAPPRRAPLVDVGTPPEPETPPETPPEEPGPSPGQAPFVPGPNWPSLAAQSTTRIGIWGDSHMAGGAFRNALASVFESRGLAVESNTQAINLTQPGIYLAVRSVCAPHKDWTLRSAYAAREPLDVGTTLSTLVSHHPGSQLWIDLRSKQGERRYTQMNVRYTPTESPVQLAIAADFGAAETVLLPARHAGGPGIEELVIRADRPLATLRVQVQSGSFRLQGLIAGPPARRTGVTLDSYGLPSATARGWANANPDSLRLALSDLHYDMAILAYGTNEGAAADFDPQHYAADLRRSLEAFRAALGPSVACVLVGPPDRGVIRLRDGGGDYRARELYALRHATIAKIQRDTAPEFGCSAWNWQAALGGVGSAYTLFRANPPLMQRDLTHMTVPGYQAWPCALFA